MGRALRVLVIEDDEAWRHLLRRNLNKRGHVICYEAARGDDGRILSVPADVAVVDLNLPGKTGIELIRALREHTPGVPVLVLSASAHSASVTGALLAGAFGYIVKGARLSEVIDAIELVAERKQVLPAHPADDKKKTDSSEGDPSASG